MRPEQQTFSTHSVFTFHGGQNLSGERANKSQIGQPTPLNNVSKEFTLQSLSALNLLRQNCHQIRACFTVLFYKASLEISCRGII